MPHINDGKAWRDDRTREAAQLNDPFVRAAEKFVAAVEVYLYDESHPGYQNPDFLGWSISQYDATKRGSGLHVNTLEWDPEDEAALHTRALSDVVFVGDRKDERLHLSDAELVRRGEAHVEGETVIVEDKTTSEPEAPEGTPAGTGKPKDEKAKAPKEPPAEKREAPSPAKEKGGDA